jgi:hypothetical protein
MEERATLNAYTAAAVALGLHVKGFKVFIAHFYSTALQCRRDAKRHSTWVDLILRKRPSA